MRYHLIPVRMAVTNNDNNKITSAGEDVEKKGAPMNCW
jgi:hypothetical protein